MEPLQPPAELLQLLVAELKAMLEECTRYPVQAARIKRLREIAKHVGWDWQVNFQMSLKPTPEHLLEYLNRMPTPPMTMSNMDTPVDLNAEARLSAAFAPTTIMGFKVQVGYCACEHYARLHWCCHASMPPTINHAPSIEARVEAISAAYETAQSKPGRVEQRPTVTETGRGVLYALGVRWEDDDDKEHKP